jgi:hypothetical protein
MDALVITVILPASFAVAYVIQKAALRVLFRIMNS